MAVGILIAGASGLCSLAVLFGGGVRGRDLSMFPLVLMIGGIPFAVGVGIAFGGCALIRSAREKDADDSRHRAIRPNDAHRRRRSKLPAEARGRRSAWRRSSPSAATASLSFTRNASFQTAISPAPMRSGSRRLREVMADPAVDAVWFARGGYGSNRIAEAALADLPAAAHGKLYMGYSDAGFLLAGLHKAGIDAAWGPMPQDVLRDEGDTAIHRALNWLVLRDRSALEPQLQPPAMAFNLTVLSNLLGTPLEPDLTGVDLLIEDVSEHLYGIDRTMFHVTASANVRRVARLRLGRVADVLPNDVDFGADEQAIVADWCARSGISFGGRADIGHDAQNKVVPFGPTRL